MRLAALCLVVSSSASAQWLQGYAQRQPIDVASPTALTDFQVLVTLDTTALRPGCPDVRFTSADGVTVLPHWLESGCGTAAARFWVRVPSVTATTRIYAYRGHATATSSSDPRAVNLFYDAFDQDPERDGGWSGVQRRSSNRAAEFVWAADAGELWLTTADPGAGAGGTFATIDPAWEDGWAVSFRFRAGGGTGADGMGFGFFHAGSEGYGNALGINRAGYGIEIDNFQSMVETSANHLAVVTTVEASAGEDFVHHVQFDTPATEDDAWHDLLVELHAGRLDVSLDDAGVVLTHTRVWDKTHRGLVLGAGTGGSTNLHRVDDIVLRKFVRPPPTVTPRALETFDAGIPAVDAGTSDAGTADGGSSGSGPAELWLTLAEPSVVAGEISGLITVHVRNAAHVDVPVPADLPITFTSSSGRGGFLLRAEDKTDQPFTVTLRAGGSSTGVYYRDFSAGVQTLSASAPGLAAANVPLEVKASESRGCGCGVADGMAVALVLAVLVRRRSMASGARRRAANADDPAALS